jgi:hypothetical protein
MQVNQKILLKINSFESFDHFTEQFRLNQILLTKKDKKVQILTLVGLNEHIQNVQKFLSADYDIEHLLEQP